MRWIEELQHLQVEMESAVRVFRHQEGVWCAKGGGHEFLITARACCMGGQTKCNVVFNGNTGSINIFHFAGE
jgi:hypothetical protein